MPARKGAKKAAPAVEEVKENGAETVAETAAPAMESEPEAAPATEAATGNGDKPAKAGRGRPKKAETAADTNGSSNGDGGVKKGRGRPAGKAKPAEDTNGDTVEKEEPAPIEAKKAKATKEVESKEVAADKPAAKGRGRPKKAAA